MRRLPGWMILILAILAGLLMWVGIMVEDEVGPIPIILASIWIVFVLVSAGRMFAPESRRQALRAGEPGRARRRRPPGGGEPAPAGGPAGWGGGSGACPGR